MADLKHRTVPSNGIQIHFVEQGSGPVVLLCHGFPETWFSFRHQIPQLAEAGYRVVAPDLRGYGETSQPALSSQYTQLHCVGDLVGLLDALEVASCTVVGHDFGAALAWNAALMRPDRFRAVVGMSLPYVPPGPVAPTEMFRRAAGEGFAYQVYFQGVGPADAELQRDVAKTLRALFYSASAEGAPRRRALPPAAQNAGFLDTMIDPGVLPAWLSAADFEHMVKTFERTSFRGGLHWYRALDLTSELMAAYRGATIDVPALFIAGEQDTVIVKGGAPALEALAKNLPRLVKISVLPGCGHWTQQESPAEVTAELLAFLDAQRSRHARA